MYIRKSSDLYSKCIVNNLEKLINKNEDNNQRKCFKIYLLYLFFVIKYSNLLFQNRKIFYI